MTDRSPPPDLIVVHLPIIAQSGSGTDSVQDAKPVVHELASAVASSAWWNEMPPATLIAKDGPEPMLGLLGRFSELDRVRLGWLQEQVSEVLPRTRRISYEDVEASCRVLAEELVARFGRAELRQFRFTAIPRGGFIVLGILSYLLDLDQRQLEGPGASEQPLIVVDDCVLTGNRLKRFLQSQTSSRLVVACLYSTPEVRQAILASEPSVSDCLSAHDLQDHAPHSLGAGYDAWRERWSEREAGSTFWTGQPDHVCFPWSEPDIAFWNEITHQEEKGWPLIPPDRCLKHRGRTAVSSVRVEMQPEGKGRIRPASQTIFGSFEDNLMLANAGGDSKIALNGVASDMWHAIVEHGEISAAATALAEIYDVDERTMRSDLERLARDLTTRGLLAETGTQDA